MNLSIIIPAFNEEDNIRDIIDSVEYSVKIPHELIVVNDHSQDQTRSIVEGLSKKYANIKLVDNLLDKGFANAIKTGINNVSCEVVVQVMADLCDDLSTIQIMFEKINSGYDIVCGSRYIKGGLRMGGSKIKGFFSCFVGRSIFYLLGIPTHDIANAFKMYKKKVVDSVSIQSSGFEISMEIPLKAYYFGFKITEVPTLWRERSRGKSSFRIFRLSRNYLKWYLWAILKRLTR
jgi:dolichol-phosphate mannosyltransferase